MAQYKPSFLWRCRVGFQLRYLNHPRSPTIHERINTYACRSHFPLDVPYRRFFFSRPQYRIHISHASECGQRAAVAEEVLVHHSADFLLLFLKNTAATFECVPVQSHGRRPSRRPSRWPPAPAPFWCPTADECGGQVAFIYRIPYYISHGSVSNSLHIR